MDASESAPSRYNKGEWTELFVLSHLLCKGQLTVGKYINDGLIRNLQVLSVSRNRSIGAEFEINEQTIRVTSSGKLIPREIICSQSRRLLPEIQVGSWVFSTDSGKQLLETLEISKLKLSAEKSDLYINVLDPISGTSGLQGYTVKSYLGSNPTLLNASKATNFVFELSPTVPTEDLDHFNSLPIRQMCKKLVDNGFSFKLINCHEIFANNLMMLDSRMVDVVSESLLAFYSMRRGEDGSFESIANYLALHNPLQVPNKDFFYHHKLKDLLEAVTFGMVPSKTWNGMQSAPGGLIIVENTGVLNSVPADRNDSLREFLLRSTKFEIASRTRHDFGSISSNAGTTHLTLNLQIRYR